MDSLTTFFRWFSGGQTQYHTLFHCMMQDRLWISLTVGLDLTVAAGYAVIVYHWWKNERSLPASPARQALATMRNIFIFCCICGYLFIPIKILWPAWRLYDIFLAVLAYFTWRYAWRTKDLKVIYSELGRSKQLQDDLDRSREESKRKSSFMNALSHDLRTPLNGLMLQADVARVSAEGNDVETLLAAIDEIKSSARATADLLDELLQCGQLDFTAEPSKPVLFSLETSIENVVNRSRALASAKGLAIRYECAPGLQVASDRVKIERVLGNLIGNATKFTASGSIRVVAEFAGKNLEIHVVDTGDGIPAVDHARVFDEFYQVQNYERNRGKGFGLGLAIARRLARQLGGDIELQSALGAGSRFSLLLPGVIAAQTKSEIFSSAEQPVTVAG